MKEHEFHIPDLEIEKFKANDWLCSNVMNKLTTSHKGSKES